MSLSAPGGYVYMLAPSGASLMSASSLDGSGGLMYPHQLFAPQAMAAAQAASGSLASFLTGPGGLVLQPLQAPHGGNNEAGTSRHGRSRRARSDEDQDVDEDGSADDQQHGRNHNAKGDTGAPRGVKEKNREAQRRFRARQKVLISGLKETMEQMQTRVAKQEQELQCLRDENAILRQLLASAQQAAAAAAIAAASNGASGAAHHHSATANGNANIISLPAGVSEAGLAQLRRLDSAAVAASGGGAPTLYLQAVGGGLTAFPGGLAQPAGPIVVQQQQQQQQGQGVKTGMSADAPPAQPQSSGDKAATTGASA